MLSREFTQMIRELIEKSLFKTQWVENKIFLGLLGFASLTYKRSAIALKGYQFTAQTQAE